MVFHRRLDPSQNHKNPPGTRYILRQGEVVLRGGLVEATPGKMDGDFVQPK